METTAVQKLYLDECTPMLREGMKGGYRAEWHASNSTLFTRAKEVREERRETQGDASGPSSA